MTRKTPHPIPQGRYLPAVRNGDVIYTSGFTPRRDGKLIHTGKIKIDAPIENSLEPVRMATQNAIWAAQACLQMGEEITLILQLNVFLNAEAGFGAHSKLADFASDLLVETFGSGCLGCRTAVGSDTLPADAPVEVNLVALVNTPRD